MTLLPEAGTLHARLGDALDLWRRLDEEAADHRRDLNRALGVSYTDEILRNDQNLRNRMFEKARAALLYLASDNSGRSPTELHEIASALSPGGAHTGGLLVQIILETVWDADPLLITATIYQNWHGGKQGFQFLPDPTDTDKDEYFDEACSLLHLIYEGTGGEPLRILVGEDRAFFESLPDHFTA